MCLRTIFSYISTDCQTIYIYIGRSVKIYINVFMYVYKYLNVCLLIGDLKFYSS